MCIGSCELSTVLYQPRIYYKHLSQILILINIYNLLQHLLSICTGCKCSCVSCELSIHASCSVTWLCHGLAVIWNQWMLSTQQVCDASTWLIWKWPIKAIRTSTSVTPSHNPIKPNRAKSLVIISLSKVRSVIGHLAIWTIIFSSHLITAKYIFHFTHARSYSMSSKPSLLSSNHSECIITIQCSLPLLPLLPAPAPLLCYPPAPTVPLLCCSYVVAANFFCSFYGYGSAYNHMKMVSTY